MSKFYRSADFKTPECRVSYAQNLFKPQDKTRDDGTVVQQYGCSLIFPDSARRVLEDVVAEVIKGQWGDRGIQMAKDGLIKSPFLSGTGKEARNKQTGELHPGMGEGLFFIRPSTQYEPVVRYKSVNIPATPEEVYSGCYGFAVLNAYAWHNKKNGDGVSFGIQYFQKLRDGDRLGGGGGVDASKYFEKIEDTGSAPEETKSGQGAGGLFG